MTTLDNLLTLYASTDKNVMQIGWTANALLNELIEEEKQAGDKHPVIRPILTNLLDELCGIDGQPGMLVKYYPNAAAARSSVSDRLRVMRYFTEKYVSGLVGRFGFNHLRACYVGDEQNWPEADVKETSLRVTWAQENNWPSPDAIRQHFSGADKNQNLIDKLMKLCKQVAELPDVDPILESYCRAIVNYHVGEDGRWCKDDAKQSELLEEKCAF